MNFESETEQLLHAVGSFPGRWSCELWPEVVYDKEITPGWTSNWQRKGWLSPLQKLRKYQQGAAGKTESKRKAIFARLLARQNEKTPDLAPPPVPYWMTTKTES